MSNPEFITRKLNEISDALGEIEIYIDDNIIADDSRHALDDTKQARLEIVRTLPGQLEETYQLKPLYDRLKSIGVSLRCMRNNLDRAEDSISRANEAIALISASIERVDENL